MSLLGALGGVLFIGGVLALLGAWATQACLSLDTPVNPTYRPNQRQQQPMVPSASVQSFPPLNQPVPTGRVETSGTGGVPAFPAGNLDWLKNFLQEILSPEDYLKYKSSFDPTPEKEEVPLALQLANKTKERGSVLAQIERERVLVGDLAKYLNFDSTHGAKVFASTGN